MNCCARVIGLHPCAPYPCCCTLTLYHDRHNRFYFYYMFALEWDKLLLPQPAQPQHQEEQNAAPCLIYPNPTP